MTMPTLTPRELARIKNDRSIRRMLAQKNHYWFFSIYLPHYIHYPFAPLHHEMFEITENEKGELSVLVAFRGSAKSTLMTLSYPIWSIVGRQRKKFVLIVSQTQAQAKLHLSNIKKELEGNDLLKKDIGPFEESDEWGANSIVISNYGARITAVSTEQSIRGIRHSEYRPDLIICDDIEDLQTVKTREGRDKTFNWFNGEIMPVGDKETKIIVVGNLLHEDCLILKLKKQMDEEKLTGKFYAFPLLGKDNLIMWPGKYPTMDDIKKQKSKIPSESAYFREYLLKIISDEDRLVHPEWLKYYDELPPTSGDQSNFHYTAVGVDLAISERESADYTAMVSAMVFGAVEDLRVYILPNPINRRMNFPTTVEEIIALSKSLGLNSKFLIEDVGYQRAIIQDLVNKNVQAEGIKVQGQDKRARLTTITHLIKQGKVLFPRKGCEQLIEQLTGFGIEKHDDLADAFSLLLVHILEEDRSGPQAFFVAFDPIVKINELGQPYVPLSMDEKF